MIGSTTEQITSNEPQVKAGTLWAAEINSKTAVSLAEKQKKDIGDLYRLIDKTNAELNQVKQRLSIVEAKNHELRARLLNGGATS